MLLLAATLLLTAVLSKIIIIAAHFAAKKYSPHSHFSDWSIRLCGGYVAARVATSLIYIKIKITYTTRTTGRLQSRGKWQAKQTLKN